MRRWYYAYDNAHMWRPQNRMFLFLSCLSHEHLNEVNLIGNMESVMWDWYWEDFYLFKRERGISSFEVSSCSSRSSTNNEISALINVLLWFHPIRDMRYYIDSFFPLFIFQTIWCYFKILFTLAIKVDTILARVLQFIGCRWTSTK